MTNDEYQQNILQYLQTMAGSVDELTSKIGKNLLDKYQKVMERKATAEAKEELNTIPDEDTPTGTLTGTLTGGTTAIEAPASTQLNLPAIINKGEITVRNDKKKQDIVPLTAKKDKKPRNVTTLLVERMMNGSIPGLARYSSNPAEVAKYFNKNVLKDALKPVYHKGELTDLSRKKIELAGKFLDEVRHVLGLDPIFEALSAERILDNNPYGVMRLITPQLTVKGINMVQDFGQLALLQMLEDHDDVLAELHREKTANRDMMLRKATSGRRDDEEPYSDEEQFFDEDNYVPEYIDEDDDITKAENEENDIGDNPIMRLPDERSMIEDELDPNHFANNEYNPGVSIEEHISKAEKGKNRTGESLQTAILEGFGFKHEPTANQKLIIEELAKVKSLNWLNKYATKADPTFVSIFSMLLQDAPAMPVNFENEREKARKLIDQFPDANQPLIIRKLITQLNDKGKIKDEALARTGWNDYWRNTPSHIDKKKK